MAYYIDRRSAAPEARLSRQPVPLADRCEAWTHQFTRCRLRRIHESAYCWQHTREIMASDEHEEARHQRALQEQFEAEDAALETSGQDWPNEEGADDDDLAF